MPAAGITAIVPVWNRRDLIAPLLANLAAQSEPPAEVVVVDNGSTDGAAEAAEAAGATVVRMGRNAGFAAAVNRGIAQCRTEWLAVVNNDVRLAPDYFERLRAAATAADAWFATGKLFSAANPGLLDGTFDVLCRGACAWRAGHGEPAGPLYAAPRAIYSAPWTAALFKTALFARTGPLEESFESYLEDVEFGVRCVRCGCAGRYVPEAVAWHRGSATLGRWHPDTVRRLSRNQVLLWARHFPASTWWPAVVAQALWGGVAWRHSAALPWLRGKWEALHLYSRMRSRYSPDGAGAILAWLRENEAFLRHAPSRYWKLYTRLAGAGHSDT
jgi:GT2 family glycosyltransferase